MKKICKTTGALFKIFCSSKTFLTMRITVFLLIFSVVQVMGGSSYSQNTRLSLNLKNVAIEKVLDEIENQSEFFFLFNQKLVNIDRKVDIDVKNKRIKDILAGLFAGEDVNCLVMDRQILLSPKYITERVNVTRDQQPQEIVVTGKVTDEDGNPLPGVNIVVKGTITGTITNMDGNYSIEVVDPEDVLVFTFIGMLSQEIEVGDQTEINTTMARDIIGLEEVVFIGYGKIKRIDVTGSVGSVDADIIKTVNRTSPYETMQGQIPGLIIQSADNKPGGGFSIRIRGSNTINSSSNTTLVVEASESVDQAGYAPGENPLFIVDGMFMNDINFLNPSDIERVDVLKDASATAIYGSRGSKGVVIIQTKKGQTGAMTVQYDSYVGINQPYHLPRIFEGEEFVTFFEDAVVGINYASGNFSFTRDDVVLGDYLRPNEMINIANGDYTDWVDLMKKNGFQTNHSLSLSGGTEKTTYGLGAAYSKKEGNFEGEDYQRFNIRGDISTKLTDWLTLSNNNYFAYAVRNEGSREGFRSCYRLRPTGSPYDANGDWLFFPLEGETFITNPLFEPGSITRETKLLDYLGNISMTITPIENLTLTTTFVPNIEFKRYGEYAGLYSKTTGGFQSRTRADVTNSGRLSWTWDNILNYGISNDNHNIDAIFIYSMFSDQFEQFRMHRRDFATDDFLFYNIDAGAIIQNVESSYTRETLESFTGRLHYGFKQRYLLTVTARYDGASMLAEGNKWALFPSAAFAWRVSEESFMENQNLFNELKVRASLGKTGSNGSGGGLRPLSSQSLIGFSYTNLGDNTTQTAYVTGLANQDLTWEKTKEWNLGLDFGVLLNRISGSIDVYSRLTSDIIFSRPLASTSGFSGVFENVGEATNKGIEVALNSVNVTGSNFRWSTSLNFATNKNEVVKLYGNLDEIVFSNQGGRFVHRVGEPVGSIYSYVWDGIWQMDEMEEAQSYGQQPGQVKVKDLNGDGVIDADNDRTTIGVNVPKWTGGLTNTFNYKNLELTFFIYTSQGATSFTYFHRSHAWDQDNRPARFNGLKTNYWTPDNPSNEWYQPGNGGPYSEGRYYKDVSFTKISYITLGYNLPQQMLSRAGISRLRVYATVQNPFIFTDYERWNPENAARNSWGSAFMNRTYMLGLNVNFVGR